MMDGPLNVKSAGCFGSDFNLNVIHLLCSEWCTDKIYSNLLHTLCYILCNTLE